jgi:molybdenum cofactor synthesis domain-containing protein
MLTLAALQAECEAFSVSGRTGALAWSMVTARIRVALLSVGAAAGGKRQLDESVELIRRTLPDEEFFEVDCQEVADEQALVRAKLRVWADTDAADVILTCGGVNLGAKERVPEATAEVLDRSLPGVAELIRLASIRIDPQVALLRLEAGVRRKTLIINLPAEPVWVQRSLPLLATLLPAAVRRLRSGDFSQSGA